MMEVWPDSRRERHVLGRDIAERLRLTPTERKALQLFGDGLTVAEIADRMFISGRTLEFHFRGAREKTAAASTRQAYFEAIRSGQIECPCKRKTHE